MLLFAFAALVSSSLCVEQDRMLDMPYRGFSFVPYNGPVQPMTKYHAPPNVIGNQGYGPNEGFNYQGHFIPYNSVKRALDLTIDHTVAGFDPTQGGRFRNLANRASYQQSKTNGYGQKQTSGYGRKNMDGYSSAPMPNYGQAAYTTQAPSGYGSNPGNAYVTTNRNYNTLKPGYARPTAPSYVTKPPSYVTKPVHEYGYQKQAYSHGYGTQNQHTPKPGYGTEGYGSGSGGNQRAAYATPTPSYGTRGISGPRPTGEQYGKPAYSQRGNVNEAAYQPSTGPYGSKTQGHNVGSYPAEKLHRKPKGYGQKTVYNMRPATAYRSGDQYRSATTTGGYPANAGYNVADNPAIGNYHGKDYGVDNEHGKEKPYNTHGSIDYGVTGSVYGQYLGPPSSYQPTYTNNRSPVYSRKEPGYGVNVESVYNHRDYGGHGSKVGGCCGSSPDPIHSLASGYLPPPSLSASHGGYGEPPGFQPLPFGGYGSSLEHQTQYIVDHPEHILTDTGYDFPSSSSYEYLGPYDALRVKKRKYFQRTK